MKKKIIFICFAITLLLFFANLSPVKAFDQTNIFPDEYIDCGVWAYDPHKSGSNVVATGEVSCSTNHPSLRVVAGLRDNTYRYTSASQQCYNTSYCVVSVTLSYVSGRQWQSDVSGYVGSWQGYYATGWKYIL